MKIHTADDNVLLTWSANPEADVAGYKVYYGWPTGYSYATSVDVGDVTSYTLSGITTETEIAVTAYDADADGTDDQVEGHESWFAMAGDPPGDLHFILTPNQSNARFGYSVSSAGDVNSDGYDDVIVGARNYDNGEGNEGAVFVFLGSADGIQGSSPADADATIAIRGSSVAGAGDVNNNGYDDIIVGASNYKDGETSEGGAFIFYGSADGITGTGPADANAVIQADKSFAYLGTTVSGAGNVNGDDYDDIIVGAPQYDTAFDNSGAAFVFYGGPGLTGTLSAAAANAVLVPNQASAFMGTSVSGAGDVNNDGYDDIIIGTPEYDQVQSNEGAAMVFLGSAAGIVGRNPTDAHAVLQSNQANAQMGTSVSGAGDIDNDGYDDVIINVPSFTNGQNAEGGAFLFLGGSTGIQGRASSAPWQTLQSNQAESGFGVSVANVGDVNNDEFDDVVIGASTYDYQFNDDGVAFIFLGSSTGLQGLTPQDAAHVLEEGQANARFGISVAGAGDVNNDNLDDIIVGAPYYNDGQSAAGAAFIYLGFPTQMVEFPIGAESVDEDVGIVNVEVALSVPLGDSVSVDYTVISATATETVDYKVLGTGTLTIPSLASSGVIKIIVIDDDSEEEQETVVLELSNPVNATLLENQFTLTIKDNDQPVNHPPTITITSPSGGETWSGDQDITWTATGPDDAVYLVDLFHSETGGNTWELIEYAESNDGGFLWDTSTVRDGIGHRIQIVFRDALIMELAKMVYAQDGDIYVMDASGTNQIKLTSTGDNSQPVFSPDGQTIVFTSLRDGHRELYVMNADGTSQSRLTTSDELQPWEPRFSPDGSQLVFSREPVGGEGPFDIYIMDLDGGTITRLTEASSPDENKSQASFSPDGSEILFVGDDNQIAVMDIDGTHEKYVGLEGSYPSWSPDGSSIAYIGAVPYLDEIQIERTGTALYVMDIHDEIARRLTDPSPNPPSDWDYYPSWAPDDIVLYFARDQGARGQGGDDVYRISQSGKNETGLYGFADGVYPHFWTSQKICKTIDISDNNFTIENHPANQPPEITVTAPNGGESWFGDREITWSASDEEDDTLTIDLYLNHDGEDRWELLAADENDDGSFTWKTADVRNGETYRIMTVVDDGTATSFDLSDDGFEIDNDVAPNTPPTITLTSPSGGETWSGEQDITWTATDDDDDTLTIDIYYNSDGGETWNLIAEDEPNDASYPWDTTSVDDGSHYRLKVVADDGTIAAHYISDSDFIIYTPIEIPHLVGWWPFDEGVGDTALDISGHGNHGTLKQEPEWVIGKLGDALDLDGENDYVSVDHSSDFEFTNFSIRFWVKPKLMSENMVMVARWEHKPNDDQEWLVDVTPVGKVSFKVTSTGDNAGSLGVLSQGALTDDTWYHITAVYDNSADNRQKIYIDGVLDNEVPGAPSVHHGSGKLIIGVHDPDTSYQRWFNGSIDNLRIYDIALSDEHVLELYLEDLDSHPPIVVVTSPTGGETWTGEQPITWTATDGDDDTLTIDLYFSVDSGETWTLIAEDEPNDGSYPWDTASVDNGDDYRVKVVADDGTDTAHDISDADFTIHNNHAPQVTLHRPRDGEDLKGMVYIAWTAWDEDDDTLSIDLYISDNSGETWSLLSGDEANDGTYLWDTATVDDSSLYRIKVEASDGLDDASDMAETNFTVTNIIPNRPPVVILTDPGGGETWSGEREITWIATDKDDDSLTGVVYYSPDSGNEWIYLADFTTKDTHYLWDTTGIPNGDDYRVKVTVSDGEDSADDSSDTDFTIHNNHPPEITVITPDGGDTLDGVEVVAWTADDEDGDTLTVDILYSRDSGTTWRHLAENEPDDGVFLWDTITVVDGHRFRVKVIVDDGLVTASDTSNGDYAIKNSVEDYPPHPPERLTARAGNSIVKLEWMDSHEPDFSTYSVYRTTGIDPQTLALLAADLTESRYHDEAVTNGEMYHYAVTATDRGSNESVYSNPVSVTPKGNPPTASLSADLNSGPAPLIVIFDVGGTDEGTIVRYDLDFGDGRKWSSAMASQVVHRYMEAGTYTAGLVVIDDDHLASEPAQTEIHVTAVQTAPAALLVADPLEGAAPLAVNFLFGGVDSNGTIVRYELDFDGDGVYDYSSMDQGTVRHIYGRPGEYAAGLKISDNDGLAGTVSQIIAVGDPGVSIDVEVTCDGDQAVSGTVPLTVSLSGSAEGGTLEDDDTYFLYLWDFDGDGNFDWSSSTSPDIDHTYTRPGFYTPTLRVLDSTFLWGTGSGTVTVEGVSETLRVWISVPKHGHKVWGSQVTLRSNTAPGHLTASVQFQYKRSLGTTVDDWLELGDLITPPPYSFTDTWDVTGLEDGEMYDLRALAMDINDNEIVSEVVSVLVTSLGADVVDGHDAAGRRQKRQTVSFQETVEVEVDDGTGIIIPYGAVGEETAATITVYEDNPHADTGAEGELMNFREVTLEGDPTLTKPVTITLPYDETGGQVAGTTGSESELFPCYWDGDQWVKITDYEVDLTNNLVACTVGHLTLFALQGGEAEPAAEDPVAGSGGTTTGSELHGSGCFIATAAYGSRLAGEVKLLSRFRDSCLLPTAAGRGLVALYYALSPPLANVIARDEHLRATARTTLKPLIRAVELMTK